VRFDEIDLPYNKKIRLIKLIQDYSREERERSVDLNKLYDTFQKWLRCLPDLIIFQNIKQAMADTMPMDLVLYKEKYNPYLKLTKSKVKTNRDFIITLTNYTKDILKNINVPNLIRDGVINDKDKYQFDLISERHRHEQDKLVISYDKNELEYIKIIKTWLKNEERFFKEIYPMFNKMAGINNRKFTDTKEMMSNKSKSGVSEAISLFISYCWESDINEDHKSWVRSLADILINNRINVILDQYELRFGSNMIHFMENAVCKADKIIVIFTPGYKKKAEARKGGVGYEYSIINAYMYKDQIESKVIPVLRMGEREDSVPDFMHQYVGIDMRTDSKFNEAIDEILRDLYNEPRFKKPALGKKPRFD
jgi:hypothetical protein